MERKEFYERIQKDFEEFKARMLKLTPEELFERGFETDFYTYMTSYLLDSEEYISDETIANLSVIEGSVLDYLYDLYLNNDGTYTYDDLCDDILETYNTLVEYEDANLD